MQLMLEDWSPSQADRRRSPRSQSGGTRRGCSRRLPPWNSMSFHLRVHGRPAANTLSLWFAVKFTSRLHPSIAHQTAPVKAPQAEVHLKTRLFFLSWMAVLDDFHGMPPEHAKKAIDAVKRTSARSMQRQAQQCQGPGTAQNQGSLGREPPLCHLFLMKKSAGRMRTTERPLLRLHRSWKSVPAR
jgi:hypothetical protein